MARDLCDKNVTILFSVPKSKFSKPKSPLKGKLGYFGYIGKVKGKAPMKPPIFVDILMNDEEGTRIKVCIGGFELDVGIKIGPKKDFQIKQLKILAIP